MPLHQGTPYYQNTPSSTFTPFAYTRTAGMHVPFSGARGDFIQSQFIELNQQFNNPNPTFPLEKVVVNNLTSSLWKQSYFVTGLQLKEEFSDEGSYKETRMRSIGLLRFDG
ncbi:hypothetical protein Q3G72_015936 [Acer saccharum]|nr:hypothetical protein Q3G72_015936 [Acer saccharum]